MEKIDEIDYESLSREEMDALIEIESRKRIGEPTASQVIKSQFGGDVKKYLKAMGKIK